MLLALSDITISWRLPYLLRMSSALPDTPPAKALQAQFQKRFAHSEVHYPTAMHGGLLALWIALAVVLTQLGAPSRSILSPQVLLAFLTCQYLVRLGRTMDAWIFRIRHSRK